jgi:hypothetical protein
MMQPFRNYLTEVRIPGLSFKVPGFGGTQEYDITRILIDLVLNNGGVRNVILMLIAGGVATAAIRALINNIDNVIYAIKSAPASRKERVAQQILLDYGIKPDAPVSNPTITDERKAEELLRRI